MASRQNKYLNKCWDFLRNVHTQKNIGWKHDPFSPNKILPTGKFSWIGSWSYNLEIVIVLLGCQIPPAKLNLELEKQPRPPSNNLTQV
jgi:hypothetical protein